MLDGWMLPAAVDGPPGRTCLYIYPGSFNLVMTTVYVSSIHDISQGCALAEQRSTRYASTAGLWLLQNNCLPFDYSSQSKQVDSDRLGPLPIHVHIISFLHRLSIQFPKLVIHDF